MMKKNIYIDKKRILPLLPQAAAAAMLSSSLAALMVTALLPVDPDKFLVGSVMVLCAVLTMLMELVSMSKAVSILIPTLGAVCGAAALLIPRGESGKSLLSMLLEQDASSVNAIILPCVCFCAVLCSAASFINRRFVLRCVTAGGMAVFLIVLIFIKMKLIPVVMMLMLAYVLIAVCQLFAPKGKNGETCGREAWYVIICLVTAAAAVLLPTPETRIPWERMLHIEGGTHMESLFDALGIEALEEPGKNTDIKTTGTSDDASSMGGWLQTNLGQPVVVSFSDGAFADRLTGSLYDSYTGKGWVCTISLTDTGYMSASQSDISAGDLMTRYESCFKATIKKNTRRDSTVFIPPYTVNINAGDYGDISRSNSRLIFSLPGVGSYTAYFIDGMPSCVLTPEERAAYLDLPASLPPRVAEFAHLITSGKTGDAEKADAIMRVLSEYTYETAVTSVPSESDFVDHFLFTEREGYCEYFASAMAVLSRCAGIPSRLAIGYGIPRSNEEIVILNNSNAHAWAELYIEGKGWTVYDPVASSAEAFVEQVTAEPEEDDGLFSSKNSGALRKTLMYTYAAIAALAILFFIFRPVIARMISRIRLSGKYRNTPGYDVLCACSRMLWVLSACGIKREKSETAEEFESRAVSQNDWLTDTAREKLGTLLALSGRVLYSGALQEITCVSGAPQAIRRAYIKKHGLFRYIRGWWKAEI